MTPDGKAKRRLSYSACVARCPWIFIAVDVILALLLCGVTVHLHGLPDFGDPTKGFDPRGTEIEGWSHVVWFMAAKIQDGDLCLVHGKNITPQGDTNGVNLLERPSLYFGGPSQPLGSAVVGWDPRSTPRLVVQARSTNSSLLTSENLQSMCQIQTKFITDPCPEQCDVISLPLLLAEFFNQSCHDVTQDNVDAVLTLLELCTHSKISVDAASWNALLPRECLEHRQFVQSVRNLFTDNDFLSNSSRLTFSPIFVQYNGSTEEMRQLYVEHWNRRQLSVGGLRVSGMSLAEHEEALFEWIIGSDIVWYALAMTLVVLILLAYLRSFSLMLTVILNVAFAAALSYWFYFVVCRFNYFPYINLLAVLLLIAIGADDLFIFYDIWREEQRLEPLIDHERLVSRVLHQGGLSVLVTSLTTAAALLANLIHSVTAIRCFGVYSAICVLANFVLFITWVPAVLVITDKLGKKTKCVSIRTQRCTSQAHQVSDKIWSRYFQAVVSRGGPYLLTMFGILTVLASVAVFVKPGLNLPSSTTTRLLVPQHPFEVYKWELKEHFSFESGDENVPLRCQFIFGVHGQDNGDYFDANDLGYLEFDNDFDVTSEHSRIWLSEFCQNLLSQDFINTQFSQNAQCYWEVLEVFAGRECSNQSSHCCNLTSLRAEVVSECMAEFSIYQAYSTTQAENNIVPGQNNIVIVENDTMTGQNDTMIGQNHTVTGQNITVIGQPIFDLTGKVKMFILEFETKYLWNSEFVQMKSVYDLLSDFAASEISNAPRGLDSGWFSGSRGHEFLFLNLQMALSGGVLSSMGLSLGVGFVVLLMTTMNILLSLYAVVTIICVLASTAGFLALLGWELAVTEALTLTLSMGLSVDFTLHLGVAYTLAGSNSRDLRVAHALETVGPAVSMAALTTFAAGAALMPAQVWAYRQFGTFLMTTMVFSWLFALFFFLPLCRLIGPINRVGDLKYFFCHKKPSSLVEAQNNKVPNVTGNNQKVLGTQNIVINNDLTQKDKTYYWNKTANKSLASSKTTDIVDHNTRSQEFHGHVSGLATSAEDLRPVKQLSPATPQDLALPSVSGNMQQFAKDRPDPNHSGQDATTMNWRDRVNAWVGQSLIHNRSWGVTKTGQNVTTDSGQPGTIDSWQHIGQSASDDGLVNTAQDDRPLKESHFSSEILLR